METATAPEIAEPGLIEMTEGMYTFGNVSLVEDSGLMVAVHPYFESNRKDMAWRQGERCWNDYLGRFEAVVTDHKGLMLTLEEHDKLEETATRYRELGRHRNSIFVSTNIGNPKLHSQNITWDTLLDFIESLNDIGEHPVYSEENPVRLVGGYYWDEFGGCLGGTARRLRERNIPIKVLRDTIFI